MRAGDREAAAEFMMRYGPRLRRRMRSLVGGALRRITDDEDLFSSVARRLDLVVLRHRVNALTAKELWALVGRIAVRAAADKAHRAEREYIEEAAMPHLSSDVGSPVETAAEDDEASVILARSRALLAGSDREILRLRVEGMPSSRVARALGVGASMVRKRWERIRKAVGAPPKSERLRDSPRRKRAGSRRSRRS